MCAKTRNRNIATPLVRASSGAYESPEAAIASQKLEWLEPHYEQVLRNCSFDEFDGRCTELLLNFLLDKGRAADAEAAWQYGVETGMLNVGGAQNAASFFSQYSRAHAATNGELYISLNQLETTFKERLNRARSAHATGSTTKPLKLVQYYRSAVSALRREHSTRFDMMAKLHGTIGMLYKRPAVITPTLLKTTCSSLLNTTRRTGV